MIRNTVHYFEQRLAAAREAADRSEGIVRETHERFVAAYSERLAQHRAAHATIDELLG